MGSNFPLFPEQASTIASRVDNLYFFLVAVSAFFSVLIATIVVVLAVRYRRRRADEVGAHIHGGMALEIVWTVIPFVISMVMFVWGTSVFFALSRPPADALEVYIVGKRWMWKAQHLTGQREINELHVPVGQPIKLLIGSEDVLHSFYIPEFRVKMDAVPGRTTTLWFEATSAGTFHLFCTEYCGTDHSGMIGSVTVMEPQEFQTWLAGGPQQGSLAEAGETLFNELGCVTCHRGTTPRGPSLEGLFGKDVKLADGSTVVADENYLRESILNPQVKMVAGYAPLMPTFQGQLNEDGVVRLLAYLKSLTTQGQTPAAPGAMPAPVQTPAAPAPGTAKPDAHE
jgi:cytochrome c oxidase subunit 2